MLRADVCYHCAKPAEINVQSPYGTHQMCGPCYQQRSLGSRYAEEHLQRPLSREEMVEELLEMREALSDG